MLYNVVHYVARSQHVSLVPINLTPTPSARRAERVLTPHIELAMLKNRRPLWRVATVPANAELMLRTDRDSNTTRVGSTADNTCATSQVISLSLVLFSVPFVSGKPDERFMMNQLITSWLTLERTSFFYPFFYPFVPASRGAPSHSARALKLLRSSFCLGVAFLRDSCRHRDLLPYQSTEDNASIGKFGIEWIEIALSLAVSRSSHFQSARV